MPTPRDVSRLNAKLPPFMAMLKGRVESYDHDLKEGTLSFHVSEQYCHSGDVVQGGFITTMLDAAMSHTVFACDDTVINLSSLEISTRYLEVTRAGPLVAKGRIVRLSHKTAFLDGQLFNTEGRLLASTHSVAKVMRKAS